MPNSIDFQVGSKFMELAGGVEVNNLQEAIKKALQEITLPDLPSSSPNASSSSSDLPRLAPPTAGGLSLETLAQMISNETRTQATKAVSYTHLDVYKRQAPDRALSWRNRWRLIP